MRSQSRREFLAQTAYGVTLSTGLGIASWDHLVPMARAELLIKPAMVSFNDEIESLIKLIEEAPRTSCFEKIAEQFAQGVAYRQIMAALYLATVRNISPDPTKGPLHSMLVVHSANWLSLDAESDDRLLPLFWALDYFKTNQGRQPWRQDSPAVNTPTGDAAIEEFRLAMKLFDPDLADRAMTGMVRSCGKGRIAEELWHYAARDYRTIGHKAIYAANAWRTLQTIGWRHAELTMRSLARSLVGCGPTMKLSGYTMAEQCYSNNVRLAGESAEKLPGDWSGAKSEASAVRDLIAVMRTGEANQASLSALEQLIAGEQQAQGIWDAVHIVAGEIMYRQPSIRPVHAVTSANALHFAFNEASEDSTRLLILLQATGWMAQFITYLPTRELPFPVRHLDELPAVDLPDNIADSVTEISGNISRRPETAGHQAFTFATNNASLAPLLRATRKLVIERADGSHLFKFPTAAMENLSLISPEWRPYLLAAMMHYLPGESTPISNVVRNARAALASA